MMTFFAVFLPPPPQKQETNRYRPRYINAIRVVFVVVQVVMHRIAALMAPDVDEDVGEIDSEYVFGHHLVLQNVTVSCHGKSRYLW